LRQANGCVAEDKEQVRRSTKAIKEDAQKAGEGTKNKLVFDAKSLERPLRHRQEDVHQVTHKWCGELKQAHDRWKRRSTSAGDFCKSSVSIGVDDQHDCTAQRCKTVQPVGSVAIPGQHN